MEAAEPKTALAKCYLSKELATAMCDNEVTTKLFPNLFIATASTAKNLVVEAGLAYTGL